jgi:polygalacturonase
VLRVEGTISGSRDPTVYPIVTQQPLDEAYRSPYMLNRQRQALISAYSARNVSVVGSGIVDGNGWDWWYGVSHETNGTYNKQVCRGGTGLPVPTSPACMIQRPKLLEFVDCHDVLVAGTSADNGRLTFKNSPFWTLHPTFCDGVRMVNLTVLAPRDHGNTVRTGTCIGSRPYVTAAEP